MVAKVLARWARKVFFAALGFASGLTCSLLFYEFVLSETDFNDAYKVLMFISSGMFLAFGFAFSRQIRCITILTLPEFTSRSGRRSIQATILILVLAGPLRNISDNGEETVRFITCVKDMLMDILLAGKDLVLAPIQHIFYDLKTAEAAGEEDKYNITSLNELINPIKEEVEDSSEINALKAENDMIDSEMGLTPRSQELESHYKVLSSDVESDRIEKSYKKKLAYRCEEVFSRGTQKCVDIFKGKYDDCYETVTVVLGWALCWPMKLDFICDILNMFTQDKVCDMGDIVDTGFGESYSLAKKGIDDFKQSFKFHVNYQGLSEMINLDHLKEAQEDLLGYYLESRKYVEWYLTLIKRGLAVSYLFVALGALSYHEEYFTRLSFDNTYITKYFLRIDERRLRDDKSVLLPLKSFERSDFSRLKRFNLTALEWKKFGDHLFAISIQAGVIFTLFAFDYIFTELLKLVKNHADVHVHQTGQHVLAIQVKGQGLLARLLRSIIKDFNVSKSIDISHFSQPCLPNPRVTPKAYYQRVILLFSVLLINSYFEAHCIRFRHCIADYFYPKRSRKRTLWLYNETLKKRKTKMTYLKSRVLENAEKFRILMTRNPLVMLAELFPRGCACLHRWKIARRKCIVCMEYGEVYRCPRCGFSYCKECFLDLDERCLLCIALQEMEQKTDQTLLNNVHV